MQLSPIATVSSTQTALAATQVGNSSSLASSALQALLGFGGLTMAASGQSGAAGSTSAPTVASSLAGQPSSQFTSNLLGALLGAQEQASGTSAGGQVNPGSASTGQASLLPAAQMAADVDDGLSSSQAGSNADKAQPRVHGAHHHHRHHGAQAGASQANASQASATASSDVDVESTGAPSSPASGAASVGQS